MNSQKLSQNIIPQLLIPSFPATVCLTENESRLQKCEVALFPEFVCLQDTPTCVNITPCFISLMFNNTDVFVFTVSDFPEDSEISQRQLQEHPEWARHE